MNKFLEVSGIIAVMAVSSSCHAYFDASDQMEFTALQKRKNVEVLSIQTMTDGLIHFSTKHPGKIADGVVQGFRQTPLLLFVSDSVVYKVRASGEKPVFVYSGGTKYNILYQDGINLVYNPTDRVEIPFSEINNAVLKRNGSNALILSGLITGLSALSIWILSNMSFDMSGAF